MVRFISEDTTAAPDPSSKSAPVRLLVLGLPRCATSSLQNALESSVLDCSPCMHMARVAPYADRLEAVTRAMQLRLPSAGAVKGGGLGNADPHREERLKILKELFDGHAAVADFPGIIFADDLMDLYPDAKIVLNGRTGGGVAWAKSINDTLRFFCTKFYIISCFLWKTDRLLYKVQWVAMDLIQERYGVLYWDPAHYGAHMDWVRSEAAKRGRKVVEWQAQDGWEPLCEVLDKPVPSEKFPHLNDTKEIVFVKRVVVARGLISWALVFGGVWAGWKYGVRGTLGERVVEGLKSLWGFF